jgi:hypothetical protein
LHKHYVLFELFSVTGKKNKARVEVTHRLHLIYEPGYMVIKLNSESHMPSAESDQTFREVSKIKSFDISSFGLDHEVEVAIRRAFVKHGL